MLAVIYYEALSTIILLAIFLCFFCLFFPRCHQNWIPETHIWLCNIASLIPILKAFCGFLLSQEKSLHYMDDI